MYSLYIRTYKDKANKASICRLYKESLGDMTSAFIVQRSIDWHRPLGVVTQERAFVCLCC